MIYIGASTKEEVKQRMKQILKKLNEVGMTINKDKFELNYDKVLYFIIIIIMLYYQYRFPRLCFSFRPYHPSLQTTSGVGTYLM